MLHAFACTPTALVVTGLLAVWYAMPWEQYWFMRYTLPQGCIQLHPEDQAGTITNASRSDTV